MAGVAKQIIGSFEDIGKDILRETAALPAEMLGVGKPKPKPQSPNAASQKSPSVPREWLAALAGKNKQKEPTVQERLEREKQDKNEKEAKESSAVQKMAPLITGSSKPKRGNLYGIKQKSSSEMSKNARQD